jgi:hypothetical protein
MTTLADTLLAPKRREALTADIVAVVEDHIARRAGLRGVALRTAMAAVRRKLPDAIPRTVTRLLPDFVAALEPMHQRSRVDGPDFARFLARDRAGAAEAMLAIADARVERSSNAALKAFYKGFRATAEHEAEDLVPGLADVLAKHL